MRKKDLMRLLEERQERVNLLMRRVETTEDLIKGYQTREQSVVDAMAAAQDAADRYLAESQKRAEAILLNAGREAEEVTRRAQAERHELLKKTEAAVAEYEGKIRAFNEAIEENAAEAVRSTNRFAAMLRKQKLQLSDLPDESRGLSGIEPAPAKDLPETGGNPAALMRNIYKLENRDLPDFDLPSYTELSDEDVAVRIGIPLMQEDAEALREDPDAESVPVYTAAGGPPEMQAARGPIAQPESAAVPTVTQFVGGEQKNETELTLDDLLDEIIQAGERS